MTDTGPGNLISAQGLFVTARARAIDWQYLVDRKPVVIKHSTAPPYLLLPEIRQLLSVMKHAHSYSPVDSVVTMTVRPGSCSVALSTPC